MEVVGILMDFFFLIKAKEKEEDSLLSSKLFLGLKKS
jgi:hypothetical protein